MKEDAVLRALKKQYWELIRKEDIGVTPEITSELDMLESAIRKYETESLVA